jgi:pimeloyl-ACP methyl ester carboxylesterase
VLRAVGGGIAESLQLFYGADVVRADWRGTWYVAAYGRLANAGRKAVKGPLLVLQGTEDAYVAYDITAGTVAGTCAEFPDNELEFLVANGTGHVPVLSATKHIWLRWIEDRFEGVAPQKGCVRSDVDSFLPDEHYQKSGSWFPQWAGAAEYSYEVPLGV